MKRVQAFEQAETLYADRIPNQICPRLSRSQGAPKDYSIQGLFHRDYPKADKAELTELAEAAGMKAVTGVSASLDFLCCGDNAGWSKMKRLMSSECHWYGMGKSAANRDR